MENVPDSSKPSLVRSVRAYWWSPDSPSGETFELPSVMTNCSLLKVLFMGPIVEVTSRVGNFNFPFSGTIQVQDNFGNPDYPIGMEVEAYFYQEYGDKSFMYPPSLSPYEPKYID